MRRLLPPLLFLPLACLSAGCLVVPFGYPTWSRTPELKVDEAEGEVVVLLVRREWSLYASMNTPLLQSKEERNLEAILAVGPSGVVAAQNRVSTDYFVALGAPLVWFVEAQRDRHELVIYRPGHRLVVAPAWSWASEVEWRPVATLAERLAALEEATFEVADLPSTDLKVKYIGLIGAEWRRLAAAVPPDSPLAPRLDAQRHWWATAPVQSLP